MYCWHRTHFFEKRASADAASLLTVEPPPEVELASEGAIPPGAADYTTLRGPRLVWMSPGVG